MIYQFWEFFLQRYAQTVELIAVYPRIDHCVNWKQFVEYRIYTIPPNLENDFFDEALTHNRLYITLICTIHFSSHILKNYKIGLFPRVS